MIPTSASASASGAKYFEAFGNSGRQYRRMPKVPTLSRTPTSSAAAPAGAAPPASGSQVWNGKNGALIANARKNPRNSQRSVAGFIDRRGSPRPAEGGGAGRGGPPHHQPGPGGPRSRAPTRPDRE